MKVKCRIPLILASQLRKFDCYSVNYFICELLSISLTAHSKCANEGGSNALVLASRALPIAAKPSQQIIEHLLRYVVVMYHGKDSLLGSVISTTTLEVGCIGVCHSSLLLILKHEGDAPLKTKTGYASCWASFLGLIFGLVC